MRATAFIFDTWTGVLVKVSQFLKQKMSRPEGDSNPHPSDSWINGSLKPHLETIDGMVAIYKNTALYPQGIRN